MQISVGTLFHWKVRGSLNTVDFEPGALATAIAAPAASILIPYIGGVTSLCEFCMFLGRDEEPMCWFGANTRHRAAMIAYLSSALGIDKSETRLVLLSRSGSLKGLIDTNRFTPESCIDLILEDAHAAVKPQAP